MKLAMMENRQYRGLILEIARAESNRVCYLLLPKGVKPDVLCFLEKAAEQYRCSMVAISGVDWNDALTPWPACGVFRKKKPFGGKAADFLTALQGEYFHDIEEALGVTDAERYLVGVSLSGLFAIWTLTQTSVLKGIAAISPSLWYDNFAEWFGSADLKGGAQKVHISLGDKEKNSKEQRMTKVETCTEEIVRALAEKGVAVDFQIFDGTHFSPILPRLELALASILPFL